MSIADWKIIDNELAHDDLPAELTGDYIVEPYPPFFWTVSGGRITKSGLPAPVLRGAFANCVSLDTAHIPHSCEEIGEYAFRNTALETVTISGECTYSVTSFPDDCTVEFYESEDDNSD